MKLPDGIPLWETSYHLDDTIRSTLAADDCRTSAELNACLLAINKGAKFHSAKAVYNGDEKCILFYLRFTTDDGDTVLRFRPDAFFECLAVSFLFVEKNEECGYRCRSVGADGISLDEIRGWDKANDSE